ncbi:MAG: FAD-dependent oxidoreductase [Caulobacteraceae bacterium]
MSDEAATPRVRSVRQTEDRFLASDVFEARSRVLPPRNGAGVHREPGREIPVYHRCDVLVVGGGPSGCAAALSAARAGADVAVLERYNHLGGLSTGGLVIWIDRMTDWQGRRVIGGFAEEVLDRLPPEGVAGPDPADWGSREPGRGLPTGASALRLSRGGHLVANIDPERLKVLSQEMLIEAGVRLVFHSWAAAPIVEDGRVTGAVFESKAGRRALMARVVVDATGDGDMFARAGAAFDVDIEEGRRPPRGQHRLHAVRRGHGALARFPPLAAGRVRRADGARARDARLLPAALRLLAQRCRPVPGAAPVGAVGPGRGRHDRAGDPLAPLHGRPLRLLPQTRARLRGRLDDAERAPARRAHTRRLAGVGRIERGQWGAGVPVPDEVGVSPSVSPKFPVVSVPYGALVPRSLDGLLACGRHVSCDANSHGFMREIPQCWLTGQAAGVAAALAADAGVQPRAVDVPDLQKALRAQGVILQDASKAEPARSQTAEA